MQMKLSYRMRAKAESSAQLNLALAVTTARII